jgi:MYXO-CTERM domain-containing protein
LSSTAAPTNELTPLDPSVESGCGCRAAQTRGGSELAGLLGLALLCFRRRRDC